MYKFVESYKSYSFMGFFFATSVAIILAVLPIYLQGLGYSDSQLGYLFAVFPLVVIFTIPFIGRISDDIGKKKIVILAIVAEIAALSMYLVAANVVMVVASRILEAVAAATLGIITLARVEDSIKSRRGEKSGWYLTFSYLGRVVGGPIAIIMADLLFIQSPFFVAIGILGFLLMLLFDKKELHFKKIHKGDFDYVGNMKRYLSFKKLRGMAILGAAMQANHLPLTIFIPLFIINDLGEPLSSVGYILFLLGVSHLFQFYFGKMSDRIGPGKLVLTGVTIFGLGSMAIFMVNNLIELALVVGIMGLGSGMWNVSAWHLMSNIGEKIKREGLVVTSYMALASIGAFVSSMFSGIIVETFSFQLFALISGVWILAAVAISAKYILSNEKISTKSRTKK